MPAVRLSIAAACIAALLAALLAGCGEEPKSTLTSPEQARAALRDAPPPLAALYAQGDALLDGGTEAYDRQIAALKGHPIVVNKWASWCTPCRQEFPYFQQMALRNGRRVAFLGINAGDSPDNAKEFLQEFPVPYPSFEDPDEDIARSAGAPAGYPITLFYDADGKIVYRHQGGYATEAKLQEEIDRYALGKQG